MKVPDAYSDLLRGEISGHGIAIEGSLQDKDKPRVLGYLNSGLLALYTRFPLLFKECRIRQLSYITTYKLNSKFAVTNTASSEVKYIIDSMIAPFTDDVIRVEFVSDEVGDVLERNSTDYDKVYLTPSMDAIEVPNPCKGNLYINLKSEVKNPVIIDITSISGVSIYHSEMTEQINYIDLNSIAKGIYIARLITNEGIISKKIVID